MRQQSSCTTPATQPAPAKARVGWRRQSDYLSNLAQPNYLSKKILQKIKLINYFQKSYSLGSIPPGSHSIRTPFYNNILQNFYLLTISFLSKTPVP